MASLSDAFKMKEGFEDPGAFYKEYINTVKQTYNPLQGMAIGVHTPLNIGNITTTPNLVDSIPMNTSPELKISGTSQMNLETPSNKLLEKYKKCEAVKTDDCSAFDDPGFASDCGMCLKVGTNHLNQPHMGGMYINGAYYDLGTCPPNFMAKTKQQCISIKKRIACETNQTFGEGCMQCTGDQRFHYVESPEIEPASLFITGSHPVTVKSGANVLAQFQSTNEWTEVELEGVRERDRVEITITSKTEGVPRIFAYIASPESAPSRFIMDLAKIVMVDSETGMKPRIRNQITENGITIFGMSGGEGKRIMRLQFNVPFSFLSKSDPNYRICLNDPYISSEQSAKELNSSACFTKTSGPGNYSKDCLEEIYASSGCTPQGKLSPTNDPYKLLYADSATKDKPRNLSEIAEFLQNTYIEASTGKTADGVALSIESWNNKSMECFGKQITNPCDVTREDGKLSDACIQYIYNNEGAQNRLGATYTLGDKASLQNGKETYCTARGTLAPFNAANIEAARAKGGVPEVKKYFDDLHRGMYAPNLGNEEKSKFTEGCIGFSSKIGDNLPTSGAIGANARYVRLLRNPSHGMHLQISKLEVIDRTGVDVALKKPTRARSEWPTYTKDKPVNGAEMFDGNMYHDYNMSSDSNSLGQEFWMVDLGEIKDVCFIHYYNRADCCQERSKGVRLQLLDDKMNVVTEKVLDYGLIQSFSFIKGEDPEIIKKILLSYNNAVSLVQYDAKLGKKYYLSYMQQYNGAAHNQNNLSYNNINTINISVVPASFRLRYAETGRTKDIASLSPIGKPNTLVRHAGFRLSADAPASYRLFRDDSSFIVVNSEKPGHVRFKSVNYPTKFIGTRRLSDGGVQRDGVFIIEKDEGDIDWAIELPFQTNKAGPEVYLSAYGRYQYDYDRAKLRCESQGGQLASRGQIEEAQRAGAQWCNFAHVNGGGVQAFPMQGSSPWCGNRAGVIQVNRSNSAGADINCYGPKPSPDFIGNAPFVLNVSNAPQRRQIWSQYDK
jgi:hypothetical protein